MLSHGHYDLILQAKETQFSASENQRLNCCSAAAESTAVSSDLDNSIHLVGILQIIHMHHHSLNFPVAVSYPLVKTVLIFMIGHNSLTKIAN